MAIARESKWNRFCRKQNNISVDQSTLPQVKGPVWGGMAHALCPAIGSVACRWLSPGCERERKEQMENRHE